MVRPAGALIFGVNPEKGHNELTLEVTETNFQEAVLDSEGKVIVDFWAEWCGPCHAVAPVLDRIADERDDIKIVKVNVDHEQGLAQRYGVSSIPLMVLFENGEPQASAIGALPKSALERALGLSEEE
jgi:thioredoxin 1